MKAYSVTGYKRPLQLVELAPPSPGERELVVAIRAAGVNVLDKKILEGAFRPVLRYKPPFVLGHDLAGVVIAAGPGVTRFTVGDEVYARARDGKIGTFAEQLAVHEDDLAPKPGTISMAAAAAVPLAALTAWQALVERADVQPGQKVLIHAGSGGVGTYAIQLAKHLGATVATTTGTSNLEWVRDLGADHVIDYRTEDFETTIDDFDVVLDSLGGDTLSKSLRTLKPGGIAIGIVGPPDPPFAEQLGLSLPLRLAIAALSRKTRRAAERLGVRYSFLFMQASGAQLHGLSELIDAGVLRPVIDREYPFEQTPDALEHVAGGRSKGKVVITVP